MAEYIDRGELLKELERFPHLGTAGSVVRSMPRADVVEVVRCKDCVKSECWYADKRRCFLWSEEGIAVFEDGFCSYGERK